MKYIERIPLDQFAYVEVHADTFDELLIASDEVKQSEVYKGRLHTPKPVSVHSDASDSPFPSDKPLPPQSKFYCKKCGAGMVYKEGIVKAGDKAGEKWRAYMCPNSTPQDNHKPQWLK